MIDRGLPHSSHWGAFSVRARGRDIEVVPHPDDPEPSTLLGNIPAALSHRARIARPMVRRGWLERGPAPDDRRGRDEFVAVSWSRALDLVAAELRRCYSEYGPRAIFGGSYGWASAGRFHDAQSQIHRFLNLAGGYVRSVNSYSSGAATVILPQMLGLTHTLVTEGRHDRAFLERFCVGWEVFEDYLLGRHDGQPKDAVWGAAICGIPADEVIDLARRATGRRTLVTCSQSLQRAEHGEQPVW